MRTLHSLAEPEPHADCIAKSKLFADWYAYYLSLGYTDLLAHTLSHGSAILHPAAYQYPYGNSNRYANGDTFFNGDTVTVTYTTDPT